MHSVRPKTNKAMKAPSIMSIGHVASFNVQHVAAASTKKVKRLKRFMNSQPVVNCRVYSAAGSNSKHSHVALHFSTAIYLGSLRRTAFRAEQSAQRATRKSLRAL
jgi:hypothetical protein